jgi:hypothetical protein
LTQVRLDLEAVLGCEDVRTRGGRQGGSLHGHPQKRVNVQDCAEAEERRGEPIVALGDPEIGQEAGVGRQPPMRLLDRDAAIDGRPGLLVGPRGRGGGQEREEEGERIE